MERLAAFPSGFAGFFHRPFVRGPSRVRSFEDTVREYLMQELTNHPEDVRDAVLGRAETLMRGMQE